MGDDTQETVQSATLAIWGGDFDPSDITRSLRLRPTKAWQKGDRKSFRRNDGTIHYFNSHYEWSGWKKWTTDLARQQSLELQLRRWAKLLEPRAAALRQIRRNGASIELNCFVASDKSIAVTLPAELLAALGSWGVGVEITWLRPARHPVRGPGRRRRA